MALSAPEEVKDPTQVRNNYGFWDELQRLRGMFRVGNAVAPAVTDDRSKGVDIGCLWVDETGGNVYSCVDNTIGAASWVQLN